jgi:hypothetical protein
MTTRELRSRTGRTALPLLIVGAAVLLAAALRRNVNATTEDRADEPERRRLVVTLTW